MVILVPSISGPRRIWRVMAGPGREPKDLLFRLAERGPSHRPSRYEPGIRIGGNGGPGSPKSSGEEHRIRFPPR